VSEIRTDSFVAHPPAKVWRALTDPVLLARWLMPNNFEARLGHQFTFRTDPVPAQGFDGVVHCEVLALEPPSLLRISWAGGPGLNTTVTWRLTPEGTGTRLLLVHDGFDDTDQHQQATMGILGGGWRGHMARRLELTLSELREQD
jgi:uncharacterized protein YndB with AHSA1/START domain